MQNLKNVKNTHGRVLLLVKLQAEAWKEPHVFTCHEYLDYAPIFALIFCRYIQIAEFVGQVLLFRLKKQTSKNVVGKTFNLLKFA